MVLRQEVPGWPQPRAGFRVPVQLPQTASDESPEDKYGRAHRKKDEWPPSLQSPTSPPPPELATPPQSWPPGLWMPGSGTGIPALSSGQGEPAGWWGGRVGEPRAPCLLPFLPHRPHIPRRDPAPQGGSGWGPVPAMTPGPLLLARSGAERPEPCPSTETPRAHCRSPHT